MTDRARLVALLGGDLLVPTPDPPSVPGGCEVVEPEQLVVAMHEDEAGLALPAFTSGEALLRWRPEGGVCAARDGWAVAELAAVDAEGRLAIDPGSPDELLVPVLELVPLLQARSVGADPATVGASPYLVAASSEPLPAEVADALRTVLADGPEVEGAHLVLIDDGGGSPGRCVAVRLVEGTDPATAMPALVDAVAAATSGAAGLPFVVEPAALRSAIEASGTDLLAD
ncbi:MAG: SseB family protein [Acidimicrobiales bacterium]